MFRPTRHSRRNERIAQLHVACQQRPLPPLETIQALLQHDGTDDLGRETDAITEIRGSDGWLPLHRVCRRQPSVQLVNLLIAHSPETLFEWTNDGVLALGARLPIHLLCQYGASLEAVQAMIDWEPQLLTAPCLHRKWTPLQYAFLCLIDHADHPLPQTWHVVKWLESTLPPHQRPPRPNLEEYRVHSFLRSDQDEEEDDEETKEEEQGDNPAADDESLQDDPVVSGVPQEPRPRQEEEEEEEEEHEDDSPPRLQPEETTEDELDQRTVQWDHIYPMNDDRDAETEDPQDRNDNHHDQEYDQRERDQFLQRERALFPHIHRDPDLFPLAQERRAPVSSSFLPLSPVQPSPLPPPQNASQELNGTTTTTRRKKPKPAAGLSFPSPLSPSTLQRGVSNSSMAQESTTTTVTSSTTSSVQSSTRNVDLSTTRAVVQGTHKSRRAVVGPFRKPRGVFARQWPNRVKQYATRLHQACADQSPACYIQELVHSCNKAVHLRSSYGGFLALHHACIWGANKKVVQCLVEAWPQSVQEPIDSGSLPLHLYLDQKATMPLVDEEALVDVVKYLVEAFPEAVRKPATKHCGMLPLHLACKSLANLAVVVEQVTEEHKAWTRIIRYLVLCYSSSVFKANQWGQTPLDLLVLARGGVGDGGVGDQVESTQQAPIDVSIQLLQQVAKQLQP